MTISERLKTCRLSSGYTLDEIAAKLCTSRQAIYKYEKGIVTNNPIDKINLLAEIYGVTPAYLMGWESNSEHSQDTLDSLGPLSDEDLDFIKKYSLSSKEDKEFIRYLFSASEEEQEMFYNIIKAVKKERR